MGSAFAQWPSVLSSVFARNGDYREEVSIAWPDQEQGLSPIKVDFGLLEPGEVNEFLANDAKLAGYFVDVLAVRYEASAMCRLITHRF